MTNETGIAADPGMTDASARRRVWWSRVAAGTITLTCVVAAALSVGANEALAGTVVGVVVVPLYVWLGSLIVLKLPDNRIGWLLIAIGAGVALNVVTDNLTANLEPSTSMTPWLWATLWLGISAWLAWLLPTLLLLFTFPTGTLVSNRWRWAPRLMVAMAATFVFLATFATDMSTAFLSPQVDPWTIRNPIGFVSRETSDAVMGIIWLTGLLGLGIGAVVAMIVRYRRAANVERTQIKWVIYAFILLPVAYAVSIFANEWTSSSLTSDALLYLAITLLPVSITVAITKYRLYDIDVVISRTLTYGVLAAFITGVYALLVVGIGSLLGSRNEPNLALSITAVAVVAVAFEPMRNKVQHVANRLVFGKRASPYEVLAQATRRLADAGTPEETLAQVTQLVAEGTGAVAAVLWVRVGEHLQPHSATPAEALIGLSPVAFDGEGVPELPGEAVIPMLHRQELLGALTITKPRGQSVTGADEKVLADVAAGFGLVLRNLGLNAELVERAEQLRVSRRRLVATQDAERHRLERDLHDGAQQQVVALKVKLGIARTLAEREGADQVVAIVTDLAATTQEAVDAMRAVAHGIYPPLLEAEGLEAALLAGRRTFSVGVDLGFEQVGRYERSVEESVYFCVVEIISRAIDGGAGLVSVSLVGLAHEIEFVVRHDGQIGDLVAVADRVDALEGRLQTNFGAAGVTISGTLPSDRSVLEPA